MVFLGPLCVFLTCRLIHSHPLALLLSCPSPLSLSLSFSVRHRFILPVMRAELCSVHEQGKGQQEGGVCTIRDKIMAPWGLVWPCTRSIKRRLLVPRSTLMSICWGLILDSPPPTLSQSHTHMYTYRGLNLGVQKYLLGSYTLGHGGDPDYSHSVGYSV